MRRRRDSSADGAESLFEFLSALERELVAVVVGELLVTRRDPLPEDCCATTEAEATAAATRAIMMRISCAPAERPT